MNKVQVFIKKNAPTILTVGSVIGLAATVATAINDTSKAISVLRYHDIENVKEHPKQAIKLTWRCYIPTMSALALTSSMIIGSNNINVRRTATALSAYTLLENRTKIYSDYVKEAIGEKAEDEILGKVNKKIVDDNPPKKEVIESGDGETLCYDSLSGRYFTSSVESIRKAVNDFNEDLLKDSFLPLNGLYDRLGLGNTYFGDQYGWTPDNLAEISFSAILTEDKEPCLCMNFDYSPPINISNLW